MDYYIDVDKRVDKLKKTKPKTKRSESLTGPKHKSKRDTNKGNKKSRPKSMFDYFEQDVILGEKETVYSDEKESPKLRNSFDNNANFCRANIINSPHRLSLCDLTKTTVVQEKTLWDKFRKATSNKKTKACKCFL